MKRPVILVTGFGAFPGAPRNPTELLMRDLAVLEGRLGRLGVTLERRVLPVVYNEIAPRLKSLIEETAPDMILHFGLAGRRHKISIETRAVNRINALRPDAAGRWAKNRAVIQGHSAFMKRALVPVQRLNAVLWQAGIASALSIDAGDYVCNQTLYLSLAMAEGTGRAVGFVHVPRFKAKALLKAASLLIVSSLPDLHRQVISPHK
jgi:pyroglutamyl-peptidase